MIPDGTRTLSPRTLARLTGLLYLVIIVCAGFSQGFVRAGLVVSGDAAATAQNIIASEGLFRMGLVTDLVAFLSDAAVAVLLYVLLRPVSRTLSMMAAAFRLVAHPAIGSLNLLNHWAAWLLLGGSADYVAVFRADQLQALALLFLDAHRYGYLIAGGFFGIALLVLGYLLYRSGYFPRLLGALVAVAGVAYLLETFGDFLVPGHEVLFATIVGFSAAIGELGLCLWLLIKGVDEDRMPARASSP